MTARKLSLLLPITPLNHIFEMLTFNCMSRGMVHLTAKILSLVTRQVIPNMRLIVFCISQKEKCEESLHKGFFLQQ